MRCPEFRTCSSSVSLTSNSSAPDVVGPGSYDREKTLRVNDIQRPNVFGSGRVTVGGGGAIKAHSPTKRRDAFPTDRRFDYT